MPNHLRISIVTPNRNGETFLEKTLRSVIDQGYPNLEYIIADGASTDGSLSIIERYTDHFARVISEPDKGHTDAINKGFAASSGEIMGWIGSDDMLMPGSLAAIDDIFRKFPDVDWITGSPRDDD